MMDLVRRWLGDERGTSFEGIALSAAVIAIAFVASADVLDYVTKKHGAAINATLRDVASLGPHAPNPSGIDYTPTGSVAGMVSRTIVDPCTGVRR